MRSPENRIQHDLAEHVILPALVVVGAGEAKASSLSIWPLICPCNVLAFTIFDRLSNMRISTPRTVSSLQGLWWREVRKNRRDAFQVSDEANVIIQLVVDAERLNSIGDRVIRETFEIRLPV